MKGVLAPPDLQRVLARLSQRFSVHRMTPDRAGDLAGFLQRAYGDQPIAVFQDVQRAAAHWKWVTELYPPCEGEGPAGWICLKDGRMVGYFGTSPAVARASGQSLSVCWGRDLIAAPEARSVGVGPLLIQAAVQESRRPFFIAGLNPMSHALFRRMGFVDLGRVPLYIKVYQPGRFAESLPRSRWLNRAAAFSFQMAGTVRSSWAGRASPGIRVERLARFDERFDRWWKEIEALFPCVIRRTSAAMNWRYFQHPRHRYTAWVAMENSRWKAAAVVRHGRSRGLPAGFITEWLGDPRDRSALAALLIRVEEWLLESAPEPLVLSRCTLHHPVLEQELRRLGFFQVPSPLHWMMASASRPDLLRALSRREGWLVNGGDSDLDAV